MSTIPRQSSTTRSKRKAPSGNLPAVLKGDLIIIGGRHVAAIRHGALTRTFDAARELFRGCLCYRADVIAVAKSQRVRYLVATERNSGRRYAVRFEDFERAAWSFRHATYGEQLALDLRQWRQLPSAGEPVQASLFGGPGR